MPEAFLKISTLASLLAIFYQDRKDRTVYWWLFPLFAVGALLLQIRNVGVIQTAIHSAINAIAIAIILLILWGYAKFKMGSSGLQAVFGLGDILFLFALAISFPTVAFTTLLVFGLLSSLLLHFIINYLLSQKRTLSKKETTVPLAGYLALFFCAVFLAHWLGYYKDLYLI